MLCANHSLTLSPETDWSSWFNMASPPGMTMNPEKMEQVVQCNEANTIYDLSTDMASMFCMVLPSLLFLSAAAVFLCSEVQVLAIPPRFILRSKLVTSVWCMTFVLFHILGHLFFVMFLLLGDTLREACSL